jgi:hypothetical protein
MPKASQDITQKQEGLTLAKLKKAKHLLEQNEARNKDDPRQFCNWKLAFIPGGYAACRSDRPVFIRLFKEWERGWGQMVSTSTGEWEMDWTRKPDFMDSEGPIFFQNFHLNA